MSTTPTVQSTSTGWTLNLPVSPPYEAIKIVTSGPSLCIKSDGQGVLWGGILNGWDLIGLSAEIKDGVLTVRVQPERETTHMIKYERVSPCPGRFVFEQKGLGQIAFEAYVQARKGRSFHGSELPAWGELGPDQHRAWAEFATKNTASAGYWAYANAMAWQTQMQTTIRPWSEVPSVIRQGWEQAMVAVQNKRLSEPAPVKSLAQIAFEAGTTHGAWHELAQNRREAWAEFATKTCARDGYTAYIAHMGAASYPTWQDLDRSAHRPWSKAMTAIMIERSRRQIADEGKVEIDLIENAQIMAMDISGSPKADTSAVTLALCGEMPTEKAEQIMNGIKAGHIRADVQMVWGPATFKTSIKFKGPRQTKTEEQFRAEYEGTFPVVPKNHTRP